MREKIKIKKEQIVGYFVIYTTAFTRDDKNNIEQSIAYKKIHNYFDKHGDKLDLNIHYDVLVNNKRKRTELLSIIDCFKQGKHRYDIPRGVVVIYDLTALGTTPDMAYENYRLLLSEHIGIYIISTAHRKYSNVDLFEEFDWDPWETEKKAIQIQDLPPFKTNQGRRIKTIELDDEFKEVYWHYENYHIPETLAYDVLGISRSTFKKYSEIYEKSSEYYTDEKKQNDFCESWDDPIERKPKRFGAIPENFLELSNALKSNNMTIYEASLRLNMSPIMVSRYLYKTNGRRAIAQACNMYKSPAIIEELEKKIKR